LTKTDVDEAFEWLVLIIGIVSAIMSQYPEFFYSLSPSNIDPSLKAAKTIVPPLIITILIWLLGKLSTNKRLQVVAKVVAWMYVVGVTWLNIYTYSLGLAWASGIPIESSPHVLHEFLTGLGMLSFFFFPLIFTYLVVIPKYREMYPDSTFLKSKVQFIITYIITQITLFTLVIVLST